MDRREMHHRPVVDPGGHLLGAVSRRDLLSVFLRPDEEIATEARAALAGVLLADPAAVRAGVGQGLVSLSGQAADADQIAMATDLINAIDGVVAVRNELTASTRH